MHRERVRKFPDFFYIEGIVGWLWFIPDDGIIDRKADRSRGGRDRY